MRVIAVLYSINLVIVTSFNIRHLGLKSANSADNPFDSIDPKGIMDSDPSIGHNDETISEMLRKLSEEWSNQKLIRHERGEVSRTDKNTVSSDVAVRITSTGVAYVLHQLLSSIRHDVVRHAPTSVKTSYLGMGLTIESIQVVHFNPPMVDIKSDDGQHVTVTTSRGDVRLLGIYSAVYKTTREGQMETLIEDLNMVLRMKVVDGKVLSSECSHSIGSVDVILKPPLPQQITDQIREVILKRIANKLCPAIEEYTAKLVKVSRKAASVEIDVNDDSPLLVPHTARVASVNNDETTITLNRKPKHEAEEVVIPQDNDHMMSVSMSEGYVKRFFADFSNKEDIIFQLHLVPEIKDLLRLKCEDEDCIGKHIQLHSAMDGSAHLESRVTSAPSLKFHDGYATLNLATDNTLSFMNRDSFHRITYLTFESRIELKVDNIRVIPQMDEEKQRTYKWTADYKIKDIKISKVKSLFEDMEQLGKNLEHIVAQHNTKTEALLSTYLQGTVPLNLNHHIKLSHSDVKIQPKQLTLLTDFKIARFLFPVFDFTNNFID